MFLSGLDDLDQKILNLLIENARYSYSDIGEKLGYSRVAIKNHMDALEARGIIEAYTAVINPQKLGSAVSCYFEIDTRPETLEAVMQQLNECPTVTQVYRTTGDCHLHAHAVAADQEELEHLLRYTMDALPGVISMRTNVILSRVKDVKCLRL